MKHSFLLLSIAALTIGTFGCKPAPKAGFESSAPAGPAPGLVAGVGQVTAALPPSGGPGRFSLLVESDQSRESVTVNIR